MNQQRRTSRPRPSPTPWLRASLLLPLLTTAALAQQPGSDPQPATPPAAEQKDPSDLGERLVRKTVNDADEDVMAEILRLMGESSRRLDVDFDAGTDTQAVQQRVMERLDDAIKQAAAQLRKQKSSPREKSADKRKQESGTKEQQEERERRQRDQATPSPEDSAADQHGDVAETKLPGGELQESRRAWGLLPLRDRDEVIQGKNEQYLDRYRLLIEQYFRALQGAEEDRP